MRKLLVPILLLAACGARADVQSVKFYGYAYDLDSGKYIYTEAYDEKIEDGRWISGTTRYYAPDGTLIGDKVLDFSADRYIPVYTLKLNNVNYKEGISKVGKDGIDMFKSSPDKGDQSITTERVPEMAADAGFHSYIYDHFDALLAGKTIKFRFAVAGQLDTYSFRVKKIGDTTFEGKPAVEFIVQPATLLRLIAPDLHLVYDPKDRRLLEFRGISNVHDPASRKAYNARITYFSKPPDDAPKNLPPLD